MKLPLDNYLRMKFLDLARNSSQVKSYLKLIDNQYIFSREEIEKYQYQKFNNIFRHHFENNTAYRKFVNENGYEDKPMVSYEDVPIVSKSFFNENIESHFVKNDIHITKFSGGSTGQPLPVHLSKDSIDAFWPSIWRAFEVYNIKPCDRILMIAGPSLFNNRSLKRQVYDYVNRFTVVSAYNLDEKVLHETYKKLYKGRINVIYGYTSSILVFLRFLEKNNLSLKLNCIFTTSETFIPSVRMLAREICDCDVIDTYGANDGGVFGFECQHHSGYHLNFERCLVEVINNEIICTDLLNTASPFIRYKVGDYTESSQIIKDKCECGRSLFRLIDVSGKVNQYIDDIDGTRIHSGFFNNLFKSDSLIKQYQVIEKSSNRLIINITHDTNSIADFEVRYREVIARRFKMPFTFVSNQKIKTLDNMKTPILIKED